MDNRIFRVNGVADDVILRDTLDLAMRQSGHCRLIGWIHKPCFGLILLWTKREGMNLFPGAITTADALLPVVKAYLDGDLEETDTPGDKDQDIDGDTKRGWLVYCENWGHVADMWEAAFAVCRSWAWYGK